MEYRNGHSEVRRSRRLVLSFVATVVNYEYCFYWMFYQARPLPLSPESSGLLRPGAVALLPGSIMHCQAQGLPAIRSTCARHSSCSWLQAMQVHGGCKKLAG